MQNKLTGSLISLLIKVFIKSKIKSFESRGDTMKFLRNLFSNKVIHNSSDSKLPQTIMKGVNPYWQQWRQDELEQGKHIGGMWEEMGHLQFEFLRKQGLLPEHKFLDVGCGSLRGGVRFVPYLNTGNYCGLDINASLIEAGKIELAKIDCLGKSPNLLVNDKFEFSKFGVQFDFALALSVFTHLYINHIGRCLVEIRKVLKPQGLFYATFFEAPTPIHLPNITQQPGGKTTKYDSDPFHYSLVELQSLAENAGLVAELVDNWNHPRAQKMIRFRIKLSPPEAATLR
jgi:SAM-dependent methyltransferase